MRSCVRFTVFVVSFLCSFWASFHLLQLLGCLSVQSGAPVQSSKLTLPPRLSVRPHFLFVTHRQFVLFVSFSCQLIRSTKYQSCGAIAVKHLLSARCQFVVLKENCFINQAIFNPRLNVQCSAMHRWRAREAKLPVLRSSYHVTSSLALLRAPQQSTPSKW